MRNSYRSKKHEKGEAEVMLFITALVICGLISGSLWVLGWVRDTKDSRVDSRHAARMARLTPAPFIPPLDPGEYYITCKKPLWAALSSEAPCEILDESYRELDIAP